MSISLVIVLRVLLASNSILMASLSIGVNYNLDNKSTKSLEDLGAVLVFDVPLGLQAHVEVAEGDGV